MYRSSVSAVALLTLALTGAACSSNAPTTPTTPTPEAINEPDWTGTLTVNGAAVLPFVATDIGTVTAILADLQPNNEDASLDIGLDLGTWSGTSCTIKISNPKVGVGGGAVGFANGAGELCARVYDSGYLTGPVTFKVTISHY